MRAGDLTLARSYVTTTPIPHRHGLWITDNLAQTIDTHSISPSLPYTRPHYTSNNKMWNDILIRNTQLISIKTKAGRGERTTMLNLISTHLYFLFIL